MHQIMTDHTFFKEHGTARPGHNTATSAGRISRSLILTPALWIVLFALLTLAVNLLAK